jgi:iron complex outermembrane receptor protein
LSPSGVRGAPVAPDLNLIPSAMVDSLEILTDGASSIYGADAVAGVVNIILRDEFEGIELRGFGTTTDQGGGEESLVSFVTGGTTDRSRFMLSAEYFNRERILLKDRTDWNECLLDLEVAPDGTVYRHCLDRRPDNAVFINSAGFAYWTPGTTDIGVPDWSDDDAANLFLGRTLTGVDNPGNLVGAASETPYNLQQEMLDSQLNGNIERINIYATGKYDLAPGHTVYVEGSYTQRQNREIFTSEQVFPALPNMIPQETCLSLNADGTCDTANQVLVTNPDGTLAMVDNPLNPFDNEPRTLPVVTLDGLAQTVQTDIDNFRLVTGIEGDLDVGWFGDNDWFYDAFVSIEESSGTSVEPGMFESNVLLSIDTLRVNWDGSLECGLERTAAGFGFLTPSECVVLDWFSPTLFDRGDGGPREFATQAENDFVFGNVINSTRIKQQHYSAMITGKLFDMSAGPVGAAFGVEYRENSIDSANDLVRSLGLSTSEIVDVERDTRGDTWISDVYGEVELPLHDTFVLNLSGRYTDEKNFGSEATWSAKAQFEPVDWLRLRATAGTTFRAPNLREQFLAGAVGTIDGNEDPCVVPNDAVEGGVYVPALEPRSARVLANCVLDNVDPTALGLQATVGIPTNTGGSEDILAETSDSFTLGFVVSQPWTDEFDLDFSVTYFDIEVNDTVEELDSSETLQRCYNDEDNLASPLCSRITRRGVGPANNTIARVDASFVNIGLQTATGYDINVRYTDDFSIGNNLWDLNATLTATLQDEVLEQINPDSPVNDLVGEAGYPELSWVARINLSTGNWTGSWRTRFIDDFSKDAADITASSNLSRRSACRTMGGPDDCVLLSWGSSKIYHDLSATYDRDTWSVSLGVRNLFDESPPLIDFGEGPERMNYVVQSTYDLFGRRAFLNLQKSF